MEFNTKQLYLLNRLVSHNETVLAIDASVRGAHAKVDDVSARVGLLEVNGDVGALGVRVAAVEATQVSQSSSIAQKASSVTVSAIDGRLTSAESGLTQKAASTTVTAIDGRLTTVEGKAVSLDSRVSVVEAVSYVGLSRFTIVAKQAASSTWPVQITSHYMSNWLGKFAQGKCTLGNPADTSAQAADCWTALTSGITALVHATVSGPVVMIDLTGLKVTTLSNATNNAGLWIVLEDVSLVPDFLNIQLGQVYDYAGGKVPMMNLGPASTFASGASTAVSVPVMMCAYYPAGSITTTLPTGIALATSTFTNLLAHTSTGTTLCFGGTLLYLK